MSSKHLQQGSGKPQIPRGKLRLYSSRFCPYAQRVHLVLDAKKIPYDVVNINLSNKPDWLYENNPLGKIPALEVESGDIIYESLIISDYLDEKYSVNQLYPKDPLQKAKDRLLIDSFSKLVNSMYKLIISSNKSYHDDYKDIIMTGLATFEKELSIREGPYFSGNRPGMLDYMIWPWCERADVLKLIGNQFELQTHCYKKLMEWRQIMRNDTTVKKSYLDPNLHLKYVQSFRAGVPDYDIVTQDGN